MARAVLFGDATIAPLGAPTVEVITIAKQDLAAGTVLDGLGDAEAALLTPAHQFPLGSVLAPGRRTRAIEWAARTGGLLIEDDYDGEFRYDRQPVGAMQALAPEHVIYAGTASKSLAPGLRLGWLVVPGHLVAEVTAAKTMISRSEAQFGLCPVRLAGDTAYGSAEMLQSLVHERDIEPTFRYSTSPGAPMTPSRAATSPSMPRPTPTAAPAASS